MCSYSMRRRTLRNTKKKHKFLAFALYSFTMLAKSDLFEVWGVKTLSVSDADAACIRGHVESVMDFWCTLPDATLSQLHSDSAFCLLYAKSMHEAALEKGHFPSEEAQKPRDVHTLDGFLAFYKDKLAKCVAGDALDKHLHKLRGQVKLNSDLESEGTLLSKVQRDALGYASNTVTMYLLANATGSGAVADWMTWEFGRVWPRVQAALAYNCDELRSRL